MLILLARAFCGVLLVGGLVSDHRAPGRSDQGALPNRAVPSVDVGYRVPCADDRLQELYAEAPTYRVCRVTAYCDRGLTASGVPSGVGQCAAPADVPFGARVYIPAIDRTFVVTDRTAKRFRHNTVDLFISDRADCLKFGRQYLECEITLPAHPVRYGSARLRAALQTIRG